MISDNLEVELHKAIAARAAGDFTAANQLFQMLLELYPDNRLVLIDAGQGKLDVGEFGQARRMFGAAYALEPTALPALLAGIASRRSGDFDDALEQFRLAELHEPNSAILYLERGSLHESRLDFRAAIADYHFAAELPKDARPRSNILQRLGACLERAGQTDELHELLESSDFKDSCDTYVSLGEAILWAQRVDAEIDDDYVIDAVSRGLDGDARFIVDVLSLRLAAPSQISEAARKRYVSYLALTSYGSAALRCLAKYQMERLTDLIRDCQRFWTPDRSISMVVSAMRSRQPFSVIRLGDGEGSFIAPFLEPGNEFLARKQQDICVNWFGSTPGPQDKAILFQDLSAAVENADLLGVPDLKRVAGELRGNARGYWGVHFAALFALQIPSEAPFVTPGIHNLLFRDHGFLTQLAQSRMLHTISCHEGLGRKLRAKFSIQHGKDLLVPGEIGIPALPPSARVGQHVPEAYERTLRDIAELPAGDLVIIAAGVCGKVYADRAKGLGLTAIDIGAVADFIMGCNTRPYFSQPAYIKVNSRLL